MTSSQADVQLTKAAQKDLKALRHDLDRALREIDALRDDPLKGHLLKGSLAGARSLEFSLKGGGEYRAVYIVHGETVCVCIVFLVGAHENIYKKAESRYAALLKAIE